MHAPRCSRAALTLGIALVASLTSLRPLLAAVLDEPTALYVDAAGTLVIADRSHNKVQAVDALGQITVLAGRGSSGFSGDGGSATLAELRRPWGVCPDGSGGMYVMDTSNNRIRRVDASGTIRTAVGSNYAGFRGDGGPATSAWLYLPMGGSVDAGGALYFADSGNHRVRRVGTDGVITTVAGNGTPSFGGDGGPAVQAGLRSPYAVFVDRSGVLFVADRGNHRVRRVGTDGIITTVTGTGDSAYAGDGGQAVSAKLCIPQGVFVDASGNVFVADAGNHRIRRIDASGTISTVAGNGVPGVGGDGGDALAASLNSPAAVWGAPDGTLYIADAANDRVRRVTPDGRITTAVGSDVPVLQRNAGARVAEGEAVAITSDSLRATDPDTAPDRLRFVVGVAPINGSLTLAERALQSGDSFTQADLDARALVYRHDDSETVNDALTFMVTDGTAWLPGATFRITVTPVLDGDEFDLTAGTGVSERNGTLYYVERLRHRVLAVDRSAVPAPVVGTGFPGALGDGGPAAQAQLRRPYDVYADPAGSLFIADTDNNHIRRVAPDGTITTFAGSFLMGFAGDGGPATQARFLYPRGIHGDGQGNLYIADTGNHRVRHIDPSGIITTVAGNGLSGFEGDGGPATRASLNAPVDVFCDGHGSLFVADTGNHRVRRIDPSGTITTVAGNGLAAFAGDSGPAAQASLNTPIGVYVDGAGALYIADAGNRRVRRVQPDGTMATLVGNGLDGREGDGGPAADAGIQQPLGVHGGSDGRLWVVDTGNSRVRWVDGLQVIHTLRPNTPPVLHVVAGLTLEEGRTAAVGAELLRATDAEDPATSLVYTVGTAPVVGRLELAGRVLGSGSTFTQADVDAGRLSYTHDGSETTEDSFTFGLGDGLLTLPGATFPITVTPRNDEPVADAGQDQSLLAPGRYVYVTLDGSGSSDADADALTYIWEADGRVLARGDRLHAQMPAVVMEVGTHHVHLTVQDAAGQRVTDEVVVVVERDGRAPHIVVLSPSDGTLVRTPQASLVGYVEEEIVLQSLKVNGRSMPFVGHAPRYDFSFGVALPDPGDNTVLVEAADVSGNVATLALTLRRDAQPPTLAVLSPLAGAVIVGDPPVVQVNGTAEDGAGVASVTVNGVAAALAGDAFSAAVELGAEGRRLLRVRATDALGNAAQQDIEVFADARPPVLTVEAPVNRALVEQSRVEVRGTATDNGSGVAAVTVNALAATLEAGAFRVTLDLADGAQTLEVVATDRAGRQTSRSVQIEVRAAPPVSPVIGLVLTDGQGRPVAGARVDLLREDGRSTGQRLNTGTEGRASFIVDPLRRYQLRVQHAGGTQTTAVLSPGQEVLVSLVTSALRLCTSQEQPVAGARVDVLKDDGTSTGLRTTTDAQGRAAFEVLPGFAHRLSVTLVGTAQSTESTSGGGEVVVHTASTGLQLTGVLGQPLPDSRVDLLREDGTSTGVRATTDAAGWAGFEVLPTMVHRFAVSRTGSTFTTSAVTGQASATVQAVAAVLALTTEAGQPVLEARVDLLRADGTATGTRATTSADGRATFEVLPGMEHAFRVTWNGGALTTGVSAGAGEVAVAAVRSTLTLLDHVGRPLPAARVDLLHDNGASTGQRSATDAAGVAGFEVLPGDVHALKVTLNRGSYTVGPMAAAEDAVVQTHLSQVALLDAAGRPVEGARVDLLGPDSVATGQHVLTDAAGLAGFEVLPDHHVRFCITYRGASHTTDLVPAGRLATLQLDVTANAVELVLLDSRGSAVADARVDLLKADGRGTGQRLATDAAGLASFTVVPNAQHCLKVTYNGGTYTTPVLLAGSRQTVRSGWSALALTDSRGSAVADARVDLLKEDGSSTGLRDTTDAGGAAGFEVLPGMLHVFRVALAGGTFQTAVLAGEAGATVQTERGEVTVLRNAAPVVGVRVDLLKADASSTGLRSTTDAAGVAGFEVLPAMPHVLRARVGSTLYSTATLSGGQDAVLETSVLAKVAGEALPGSGFALLPGYPNPFNPSTTLRYVLDQPALVRLTVYSVTGQCVRLLVDRDELAGAHAVTWDGRDDRGLPAATGVYVLRLQAGPQLATGQVTFAR